MSFVLWMAIGFAVILTKPEFRFGLAHDLQSPNLHHALCGVATLCVLAFIWPLPALIWTWERFNP